MSSFSAAVQLVFLGLAASSVAQFQEQNFDDFGASQFQQPQPQPQPQRFTPQFQAQPHRVAPKIRRPATRFVDPQSVTITPSSNQGIQSPQTRFPVRQQFTQPSPVVRAPARQQFDAQQFAQPPPVARAPIRQQFDSEQFAQGAQAPPPQELFQQPPQQFQTFDSAPALVPQVAVRTQSRAPLEPVVVAPVRASRPKTVVDPEAEKIAQQQAQNAKYSFQASVTDTLSDTQHVREEVRDGLALKGVYSYSDGYFKRTVHYEADENGYRVVKEDVEPIGDGPQEDPNGTAEVKSNVGGASLQYTITAADIPFRQRQSQQPQFQQSFLPQQ